MEFYKIQKKNFEFSKIPKFQKYLGKLIIFLEFWNFGKLEVFLEFWKIQKKPKVFWNVGRKPVRTLCFFGICYEIPKKKKTLVFWCFGIKFQSVCYWPGDGATPCFWDNKLRTTKLGLWVKRPMWDLRCQISKISPTHHRRKQPPTKQGEGGNTPTHDHGRGVGGLGMLTHIFKNWVGQGHQLYSPLLAATLAYSTRLSLASDWWW